MSNTSTATILNNLLITFTATSFWGYHAHGRKRNSARYAANEAFDIIEILHPVSICKSLADKAGSLMKDHELI